MTVPKDQLPVARKHDPLAGSDRPLLNFLKWIAIVGTLAFGTVTLGFITAHRGIGIGFLVLTIIFGLLWRVVTGRLGS